MTMVPFYYFLFFLITITLIILKDAGYLDLSWIWVTAFLWFPALLFFVVAGILWLKYEQFDDRETV